MQLQNDWTLKFSTAFKDAGDLYRFLEWEMPAGIKEVDSTYPLFIPMRLAKKIKRQGPAGVLAREFMPDKLELDPDLKGLKDPIGDKAFNLAPQLIHRYPSRALFTATSICPVHCRYCFRKNELNSADEIFQAQFEETISYLKSHPEISEIIFTGGDPLTLSNARLEKYLLAFAAVKSLKDVRFHTRFPVIMPERIDSGLIQLLTDASKTFRTVTVAIHANHADEFDQDCEEAILRLANSPVQLLSQTVLLKDVNDDPDTLAELIHVFLKLKIRPYYLHHPDRVQGGMHFYVSLREGRMMYAKLRQRLPGWALPHYVIDVPGGYGKVPAFNPENTTFSGLLLSQDGELVESSEPDLFV
ncbi:MAG TPA: KamA family radical SAM protein [Bacteriovoracaceae bacterium]|nr:KamA family radical SAM protein [Bacteriovoracaceae bacterium]